MENDNTIIELLQIESKNKGYISPEAITNISNKLSVPESDVYGVASFYSQFSLTKPAKNIIEICTGTACFVLGGETLIQTVKSKLNIGLNEYTKDNKFYLSGVRCLGCCGVAPVIRVNGHIYDKVTPEMIISIIDELNN